jgi:exopolysaccharide biosynthesis polyprenyl glycosylphosphotransferase
MANIIGKKEGMTLFLGDIAVLLISLLLTIVIRYGSLSSQEIVVGHFKPFSIIFIISLVIYFIAGLYEKHTVFLKNKLSSILLRVQFFNAVVIIAFFYFIPYFLITPKVTMFIYLICSFLLMLAWRTAIVQVVTTRRKYKALLIANGSDADDLYNEINNNSKYGISFVLRINPDTDIKTGDEILDCIKNNGITYVVADFANKKVDELMPLLYKLIFSGVQFSDIQKVYEGVFDKVPLLLVNDTWFLENVSTSPKATFDILKRGTDIILSTILGIISLIFYPFVYLLIKLDDGGVIFSYQYRVGQNNKIVKIAKFRTMSIANDGGKWNPGDDKKQKNVVTRVGKFLRKSRIDELPQLWNVFAGDISLIGPRPEFEEPVTQYAKAIPYYNVRHIVKPGLSGWAQIYGRHPHHGVHVDDTRDKLSYDLFYIKNRSILLDVKIALQTLKVLVSFMGK